MFLAVYMKRYKIGFDVWSFGWEVSSDYKLFEGLRSKCRILMLRLKWCYAQGHKLLVSNNRALNEPHRLR